MHMIQSQEQPENGQYNNYYTEFKSISALLVKTVATYTIVEELFYTIAAIAELVLSRT